MPRKTRDGSRTRTRRKGEDWIRASIKIIGVGGGGSNAVSRMNKEGIKGVEFYCVNTDAQALDKIEMPNRIRIGDKLTKGLGVGGDPNLGEESAEENQERLLKSINGADMVFIAVGMGGGTGTGAAPVISRIARSAGAITVAVVTKPFTFEGSKRRRIAEEGIRQLTDKVDTLVTISNDRLLESIDTDLSVMDSFKMVDDVLLQGIQAIADVIMVPGEINVDFADVKSIMSNSGHALMSIGSGSGDDKVKEAVEAVLSSPLLDTPISGATGVLFNISGGHDLTLREVNHIAELIGESVNPEAEKIFGVVNDATLDGQVRITLIATGLAHDPMAQALSREYRRFRVDHTEEVKESPVSSSNLYQHSLDMGVPIFTRRRGENGEGQGFK